MNDLTLDTASDGCRFDVGVFSGPLDLLLYLIKKEEVDIYDIPIARITRQYIKYLELMKVLNLEVAGEFILMAATLIRIKTRLLLPRDESDPEEVDPREELIMALVEYKKFKEAGEVLREKGLFVPPCPVGATVGNVDEYSDVTLFDLITAFRDALTQRPEETVHEVQEVEVTVEDRMRYVLSILSEHESATFEQLFADMPRRIVAVVTFIALLEMARVRRIAIRQAVPFAHLRVYRGERFPAALDSLDIIGHEEKFEETLG